MRIDDIRRKNLSAYCRDACNGNQAELARRAQRKPNQIADMLAGRKAFGEKVARDIEANLELTEGWLDASPVPPVTPAHPAPGEGLSVAPAAREPTLPELLDWLAERLAKTDQRTRDAVGELLSRYVQAPEDGARLVKAIQALLEPDA